MRWQLIFKTVVLIIVTGVFAVGCGAPPAEQLPEVDAINPFTTEGYDFYFVSEEAYAPISYMIDGEPHGISVDLVRAAFERMGYKVKIELYPWARCQAMVAHGSADAFFSAYKTLEREKKYDYGHEPLFVEKNVFFVRKDSAITYSGDIASLKPYTVGTYTGYVTLEEYIASGVLDKVDYSGNVEESINKLEAGNRNIDLLLNTDFVIWYAAEKMGLADQFKELPVAFSEYPTYMAFTKTKDLSLVIAETDTELKKMKEDGTYEAIVQKYIRER